ncbi:MAG: hypothetical protein IKB88_09145 [Clostridia bacterium]|nr:hypothetical protein [Clostridia bacterium]
MTELPINKKEYEFSVLIIDFIAKIKKYNSDNNDIYNLKFFPEIKGYKIRFDVDDYQFEIRLKKNLINGLNIRKYVNGRFQKGYSFHSHSPQDNEFIINRLMR